jgi:hypothetical protein
LQQGSQLYFYSPTRNIFVLPAPTELAVVILVVERFSSASRIQVVATDLDRILT